MATNETATPILACESRKQAAVRIEASKQALIRRIQALGERPVDPLGVLLVGGVNAEEAKYALKLGIPDADLTLRLIKTCIEGKSTRSNGYFAEDVEDILIPLMQRPDLQTEAGGEVIAWVLGGARRTSEGFECALREYYRNVPITQRTIDIALQAALQINDARLMDVAIRLSMQVYERMRELDDGTTEEIDLMVHNIETIVAGFSELIGGNIGTEVLLVAKFLGVACPTSILEICRPHLRGGLPGPRWIQLKNVDLAKRLGLWEPITDLEAERAGYQRCYDGLGAAVSLWEALCGARPVHPGKSVQRHIEERDLTWDTRYPDGEHEIDF